MTKNEGLNICFLGTARYAYPLDLTTRKKFCLLSSLGQLYAIGFSQGAHFRHFSDYADFWTLPAFRFPVLRYLTFFLITPVLTLWLLWRRNIQIIVAQGPYEGAAAAVSKLVSRCFGHPVALIVESHGDFEASLFMQRRVFLQSVHKFMMKCLARFGLHHADLLRAVSNSTREQVERWKPRCPVFQFVTWTDIDVFFEAGEAKHATLSSRILYAGVFIPRKGIIHLIHAFERLAKDFPEAMLDIVGKNDNPGYTEKLKTAAMASGLGDRIYFVDVVPQQMLAKLMEEAGMLVLPSYSEGLPRVIFEGMAAGLPVIATTVSGIPEIVRDGINGFLVAPGDEAALEIKMRWMLDHPSERQNMARNAYRFAKDFFSPQFYVEQYQKMFETALNS
ncbi:hypothetical protein CSB45_00250 [candidate division KSB3 bacterium]|uniref:Glycosyl transferase family 1 domain-containing protein n=1 Tax=candidate division KSB3 bacterium TaxID=2044937 RepID=A0A2G6EF30_9BACT|nr:MAG: hypothetical protein CSB45_00250 [candidate division KSB3 bacterium]PIE28375.1 MAG: hypothetical protein CSA57_14100 [candidate division KSB3 bacterium]